MTEPASSSWIWERLEQIRRENADQHARLRQDLQQGADRLRTEMREELRTILAKQQEMGEDILTMQVERRAEGETQVRRSTWISLVASGALTLLVKFVEAAIPHRP